MTVQPPDGEIVQFLATLGIDDLDPHNPFHLRLVDACHRTKGMLLGARLVALEWVFNWDLERYGTEWATAKTEYEVARAKAIVRFRDEGEKSGAMCEVKADALDEIRDLHLRYRVAEQMMRLANKRVGTIKNQMEVWRSQNANQRAADQFHARTGV